MLCISTIVPWDILKEVKIGRESARRTQSAASDTDGIKTKNKTAGISQIICILRNNAAVSPQLKLLHAGLLDFGHTGIVRCTWQDTCHARGVAVRQ